MVAVRQATSAAGGGAITVTTTAATQALDVVIAVEFVSGGTAPQTAPTTGTWTTLGEYNTGSNTRFRAWARSAGTAGAQSVTINGSGNRVLLVATLERADIADLYAGASAAYFGGGATTVSWAIPSVTGDEGSSLELIGYGFTDNSGNTTAINHPTGTTELVERVQGVPVLGVGLASTTQASPGSTGTRTVASTAGFASGGWAGFHLWIRDGQIPINASDSAIGSETLTVAPQLQAADTGAGSEQASIAASLAAADQAAGTEAVSFNGFTGQYDGTAVGTESVQAGPLSAKDSTDTATGGETVSITSVLDALHDAGIGSETVGLLRQSTIPDAGTGAITVGIGPILGDSGTGTEEVRIVELPATLVLPIIPERRYELVVVSRIPQASGEPTLQEIDPIKWLSISYTDTISAPQDLTVTSQISTLPESVLQHLRQPDQFPCELWVRRDGVIVFAGPLQGWQVQDQKLSLKATGLLGYLAMMGIETDQPFLAKDQATVVKTLVDAWQASEYGHFGIDTSKMTPTGRTLDVSYLRDELPSVLKAVDDLGRAEGGFDFEVDPSTRQLSLWSPQRGVDRSEGPDAIIFDRRNVTSSNLLCSIAPADLASDVFGTGSKSGGDAPLFSAVSNPQLRAQYGRTVITRSYSNIADQAQLDAQVAAVRDARASAFIVPGTKVRVSPDADLPAYREGDTVSYDLGGELGTSGAFRIRSRTVTVDESGRESVDLEPV